jgi:hypothetical protein
MEHLAQCEIFRAADLIGQQGLNDLLEGLWRELRRAIEEAEAQPEEWLP